jgi:uncharacterized membrane protein
MLLITDPLGILTVLLLIEGSVLLLAEHPRTARLFKALPAMFWIYLLPTVASSLGLIPQDSPLYRAIIQVCLPACLILLFLPVDLRAILRLGPSALLMMLASSLGIVLGGPLVLLALGSWLPADAWSGFGALSGSWLGGSANMVAVKESIGTPDSIFPLMVVVDVVVAYSWMGLVMALAALQPRFDRWNRSRTGVMERLAQKLAGAGEQDRLPLTLPHLLAMLALAAGGAFISTRVASMLPVVRGVITGYTWTILLVTALGILLSWTPARRLERFGASRVGYGLLYLVLTSIGAKADLSGIAQAPLLILAGGLWVGFHGLLLLAASRLVRAPMFLWATASQANIGGPVSAPIVAATYQPSLAQVGLLLAVLGNVCGTYLGILCSMLCRLAVGG